jgi:ABC-2 type transport system permease protein
MSTTAIDEPAPVPARGSLLGDAWVVARRSLRHMRREPETLSDASFQPIMFVLLFTYVFGGAIAVPGGDYEEFLIGGIFAQTIVFVGTFGVGMAIAADRANGVMDRFRSLPIARGAVIGGHALAHLLRVALPLVLMSLCGLAIGWRIHTDLAHAVAAYGLLVIFAFAMIWVGVLLGSLLPSPEAVQGATIVAIFPLTFIASTFVPTQTMPGVLRVFAEWNPISALAGALRSLFGNPGAGAGAGAPWSLQHPVLYTLLSCAVIIVVCAPLAVNRFHQAVEH